VQLHPARNVVVHVDLQRVVENEQIRLKLPIHFKGQSISPGVKVQGGVVSHLRQDIEVVTLPKDLPEFLEVDMSGMSLNETKFLSDIPLPRASRFPSWPTATPRLCRSTARVPKSRSQSQKPLLPHPPRVQPLPQLLLLGAAKAGDAKADAAPVEEGTCEEVRYVLGPTPVFGRCAGLRPFGRGASRALDRSPALFGLFSLSCQVCRSS